MQDPGLPELAGFMTELWEFLKRNYAEPDFEEVALEVSRLEKKYPYQLCQDMMIACIADIERRRRNGKQAL